MKQLIWKELREQRYIPIAHGALVIVVIAVWHGMTRYMTLMHHAVPQLQIQETIPILFLGISIAGLFAGSGAVAPEIGNGTLGFLNALPTGRRGILTAKVAASLATTALSVAYALAGYVIVMLLVFGRSGFHFAVSAICGRYQDMAQLMFVAPLYAVYGYAVCLYVSTVVDRNVVAVALGLVIALGVYLLYGGLVVMLQIRAGGPWGAVFLVSGILVAPSAVFFAASYVGFCSGSVLLPGPRFRRAAAVLTSGLAVSAVVLTLVGVAINKAAAAIDARQLAALPRSFFGLAHPGGELRLRVVFPKGTTASEYSQEIYLSRQGNAEPLSLRVRNAEHAAEFGMLPKGAKEPTSTSVSDDYVTATVRNPRDVYIKVRRHNVSGTYHEQLSLLDKAGATVRVIGIENVTL